MRSLAQVTALCLACAAQAAWALGLGDIQLHSALNQPLRAEIPLFAVKPGEAALIDARVAPDTAFARAGIEFAPVLSDLRFRVVEGATSDQAVLQITTAVPVREPFVAVLLEVSWPDGRLVREFTLLLDPPVIASGQRAPRPLSSFDRPSESMAATGIAPAPAARDTGGRTYGPVRAQETLWSIAYAQRPDDSVSMDRMMQAIYDANPEAFDGSISRIRAGSMLRIPSVGEIRATDPAQARSELARERRASGATPSPPVESVEPRTPAAQPSPPPVATQPAPEPEGQLKLSPPEEQAAAKPAPPSGPAETPRASEEAPTAAAPAPATETAPVQTTAPIQIRDNSARALELLAAHSRDQAARQAAGEQLAAETAKAAAAEPPPEPTPAPAPPAAEPAAQAPAQPSASPFADEAAPTTEAPAPAPPAAAEPPTSVDVTAGDQKPPPKVEDSLPTADAGAEAFNPLLLLGLVVAALLLLGIAAVRLRQWRAARQTIQLPPVVLSQAGDLGEPPFTSALEAPARAQPRLADTVRAAPQPAPAMETTLQRKTLPPEQTTQQFMAVSTPEPTATLPGMMETPSSDPYADIMGEADIHIAYGLYDEAARLLQEPLAKSPDRKDLHLKLLEVYFSANMAKEFEAQAGKMRGILAGAGDPDWEKVCIMGRQLCPDSALFAGGGAGGAGAAGIGPTADLDFTSMLAGEQGAAPAAKAAEPVRPAGGGAGSLDLDLSGFDLGVGADSTSPAAPATAPAKPGTPAAPAADTNTLDFNLEDFNLETPPVRPAAARAAPQPKDSSLDIDLADFDLGAPETPASLEPAQAPGATAGDTGGELAIDDLLSTDLEVGEGQADTRLDLARAYMDMGEPAMAQSLLQEVIAQGNAAQKQEAQELLGRLGPV